MEISFIHQPFPVASSFLFNCCCEATTFPASFSQSNTTRKSQLCNLALSKQLYITGPNISNQFDSSKAEQIWMKNVTIQWISWLFTLTRAEISELPLVRLDVSCNRISNVPLCYRHLRHLQSIMLDNNPLQMPPAQICSKGKYHIFKYLNMEACKRSQEELERHLRPTGFNSWWGAGGRFLLVPTSHITNDIFNVIQ